MALFENAVVTDIYAPIPVFSERGRVFSMEKRKSYGLSFCTGGQITYTQNGKSCIGHAGNVILLPKDATYSLYGDKEGLFHVINFQCEHLDCREITAIPLSNPTACLRKMKLLSQQFLFNDKHLKIYNLFYELLDQIQWQQSAAHNPLSPMMAYLEQHISDPELTNEKLAARMGISEVYFRKLFKNHYGITPKQYILDVRISKAKQLLPDSSFSVTAIAELCGFSSVYHFCKIFKQKTDLTPTEYAENNQYKTI